MSCGHLHLDSGRVVGVEAPHATSSGSAGSTTPCRRGAAGGLALLKGAAASGSGATWRRQFAGRARSAAHGRRTCWSGLANMVLISRHSRLLFSLTHHFVLFLFFCTDWPGKCEQAKWNLNLNVNLTCCLGFVSLRLFRSTSLWWWPWDTIGRVSGLAAIAFRQLEMTANVKPNYWCIWFCHHLLENKLTNTI